MAPPNFYFQKPAVVEIVITNFRGSLFWTPCYKWYSLVPVDPKPGLIGRVATGRASSVKSRGRGVTIYLLSMPFL